MTPEPNTKPTELHKAKLLEHIRALARLGYGYEDIAALLEIKPSSIVRPFIIGRDK